MQKFTLDPAHSEIRQHFQQSPVLPPPVLEARILSLNDEQRLMFDRVAACLERDEVFHFHVDAAAGCGKISLCHTILHLMRSVDKIVLCCATTGIAALQYETGRTAHSLFHLPSTDEKDSDGRMDSRLMHIMEEGRTSTRIELLRNASVILWDEITMCHRMHYEAVDRLLRAIMRTPNSPFGGKNMITIGDLRQPVAASIVSSPLWGSFTIFPLHERSENIE